MLVNSLTHFFFEIVNKPYYNIIPYLKIEIISKDFSQIYYFRSIIN